MDTPDVKKSAGMAYVAGAFGVWGLLPLYWRAFSAIDSLQIMACRIAFSLLFIWLFLAWRRNLHWPRLLLDPVSLMPLLRSAMLISLNWGIYIWAVNAGHTVEASLGYFINPLVNVLLGLIFFKEKLPILQWVAFGLAFAGVALLTLFSGKVPWISLCLAFTFAFYGLSKKRLTLNSLEALGAETLLMLPLAILILTVRQIQGAGVFSGPPIRSLLLVPSGIISAIPLYWFAQGAKAIPLSTMGFLQFISPTLQLIIGVAVFREAFPAKNFLAFGFVWLGLLFYALSLARPSAGPDKTRSDAG